MKRKQETSNNININNEQELSINKHIRDEKERRQAKTIVAVYLVFVFLVCVYFIFIYNRAYDAPSFSSRMPRYDQLGNPIAIDNEINRIVSLCSRSTEILMMLGLDYRIVGLDEKSINALSPDVIIAPSFIAYKSPNPLAGAINSNIIYMTPSNSVAAVVNDIEFLSTLLGAWRAGYVLTNNIQADVAFMRQFVNEIDTRKTVYFEIQAVPYPKSFGRGVFLNELLNIAGLENIFIQKEGWFPIDEESILALNPDVILTNSLYGDNAILQIASRQGWSTISAVMNNKIYAIDIGLFTHPINNIGYVLLEIMTSVYPEIFR